MNKTIDPNTLYNAATELHHRNTHGQWKNGIPQSFHQIREQYNLQDNDHQWIMVVEHIIYRQTLQHYINTQTNKDHHTNYNWTTTTDNNGTHSQIHIGTQPLPIWVHKNDNWFYVTREPTGNLIQALQNTAGRTLFKKINDAKKFAKYLANINKT